MHRSTTRVARILSSRDKEIDDLHGLVDSLTSPEREGGGEVPVAKRGGERPSVALRGRERGEAPGWMEGDMVVGAGPVVVGICILFSILEWLL